MPAELDGTPHASFMAVKKNNAAVAGLPVALDSSGYSPFIVSTLVDNK